MKKIKNTALAVGAGAYALFACAAQAASLGDVVYFDFASSGTATSLVDDGNQFTFSDSSGIYDLTAAGYAKTRRGDVEATTLVHAESDYSAYRYRVDNSVSGLGICSDGDSRGNLRNCLQDADQFAVDSKNATEWVAFTLPDELKVTGIKFAPTNNKRGKVNVYGGSITGNNVFANMPLVTEYSYNGKAGPQMLEIDPIMGTSVLVGTESGAGRYTVTGLYAQVVPVPASVWMMMSALGVLFGARTRRKVQAPA